MIQNSKKDQRVEGRNNYDRKTFEYQVKEFKELKVGNIIRRSSNEVVQFIELQLHSFSNKINI